MATRIGNARGQGRAGGRWPSGGLGRVGSVAAGLFIDHRWGEPPTRWHPVAAFGTAMTGLEQRVYADRRDAGAVYTMAGVCLGGGAGLVLQTLLGRRVAVAVATGLAVSGSMLDREALKVAALLASDDLPAARFALRALVGRSPAELDGPAITRAVIESVAENTVDAVTAPLLWAMAGGAPGVLAYRAINTMDAMVGHRDPRYRRFGWASARLDDAANLVAARVTAALTLAPLGGKRQLVARVRAEARRHPSPNGGLIEAAFAHRLGIVIGGVNRYHGQTEDRGTLGTGRPPVPTDINRAIALRRRVCRQLAWLLLGIEAGFTLFRATRKSSGPRRHTLKHVERHSIP